MNPNPFALQHAPLQDGNAIEARSLEMVEEGCKENPVFQSFSPQEKEVVKRMIHTTTCFDQVIGSIRFLNDGVMGVGGLLKEGAVIITDTSMIRSGISSMYTKKFGNTTTCRVSDEAIVEMAKVEAKTRSHVAVRESILEHRDRPLILACGNAPTFLYSAIETLVTHQMDAKQVGIIAFPVGFVNVVEAKEYTMKYMEYGNSPGLVLEGRFGSSPMVVAALHAIYRQI